MINKNMITTTNMENIYKQESKLSLGHFVIKAPDGKYSLIIKNGGRTYKTDGLLKPGEYLKVPNSISYYNKGTVTDINTEESMILNNRMITAKDGFGVNRREIITYYYKNNQVNSTIKVSATNDNGKYVGRRTAYLVDNIRTNTQYFSSSSIPLLDNSIKLDTINYVLRKTKTNVYSRNLWVNGSKVELSAVIKDEFGQNVNTGKVSFTVDNQIIRHSNGSILYKYVNNSLVTYKLNIPLMFKKTNHAYSVMYLSNDKYDSSNGKAVIHVLNPIILYANHVKSAFIGDKVTIKNIIKYTQNNTPVTGGSVFYKINGKTVLNNNNKTIMKNVKNGLVIFNYTFGSKFGAKTYNLTTVYINGAFRKEVTTRITLKKIITDIISPKISVNKYNVLHFNGKLVEIINKKQLKYNSQLSAKINGKTLKLNGTTRVFNINNGVIDIYFLLPTKYKNKRNNLTIVVPELKETLGLRKKYTFSVA